MDLCTYIRIDMSRGCACVFVCLRVLKTEKSHSPMLGIADSEQKHIANRTKCLNAVFLMAWVYIVHHE